MRMMNYENKDLILKSERTRLRKDACINFFENIIVGVLNIIIFIDKKHIRFNPPREYKI